MKKVEVEHSKYIMISTTNFKKWLDGDGVLYIENGRVIYREGKVEDGES